MSTSTTVEYGVRYQNGDEDWNTRSWFGHIESPEMRRSFREQYDLRMKQYGLPPMPLTFLHRTVTTTTDAPTVIEDAIVPEIPEVPTPPAVDPVEDIPAAPDAEVPAPPIEDIPAAAPDEGAAPPADGDVVGEESPVDTEEGSEPDANPPAADDEGEHDNGG